MTTAIVSALLAILNLIVPNATGTLIVKIIDGLLTLIPFVVKEAKDLAPVVRNIIDQLKGNGDVSTEQLNQLDAMNSELDKAFDLSDADAAAEDAAADPNNKQG